MSRLYFDLETLRLKLFSSLLFYCVNEEIEILYGCDSKKLKCCDNYSSERNVFVAFDC